MENHPVYNSKVDQISQVLSPGQLNTLARCLREVIEGQHGDVTITVKGGAIRFISTRISKDFVEME